VQASLQRQATGHGHVQAFGVEGALQGAGFHGLLALFQGGFQGLLHLVGELAHLRARLGSVFGHVAHHTHDGGVTSQGGYAPILQGGFIDHGLQAVQPLLLNFLQHAFNLLQTELLIGHNSSEK
jgi:hypothetical protein